MVSARDRAMRRWARSEAERAAVDRWERIGAKLAVARDDLRKQATTARTDEARSRLDEAAKAVADAHTAWDEAVGADACVIALMPQLQGLAEANESTAYRVGIMVAVRNIAEDYAPLA